MSCEPPQVKASALRVEHYNAVVTAIRAARPWLWILRIRPDTGPVLFLPGQYTTLGLGNWEPVVEGCRNQPEPPARPALIRRAYSFSSPIFDEQGRLANAAAAEFLEFYIVLAGGEPGRPIGLTPRLFALEPGDRLHVGPRAKGTFTLAPVGDRDDDVVFASTGTGEAPHNCMIAELLSRRHRGRILSVVGVRERADLAYEEVHRELERRFANYRYVALTTREPENADPRRSDYVGKRYVQQFFASDEWELTWGSIDPERTHVFCCGNPGMIGIPHLDSEGRHLYPEPTGLIEVLEGRGFHADLPKQPGNVHFEKFW